MDPLAPLPRLNADLPGTGGVIKTQLQDFRVEELPDVEPCGSGEHLYLWLEKRDLSALDLEGLLSERLNIAPRDIGMAGMKDARAVTRQFVSVPKRCEAGLKAIDHEAVTILSIKAHHSKLKTGQLRGNRFEVVLRNIDDEALPRAQAILERLERTGMPNFYGPQRFGIHGSTLKQGAQLLRGEIHPRTGRMRRLMLSAVQAELFNRWLAQRIDDGLMHQVIPGEILRSLLTEMPRIVSDGDDSAQRFAARELVPTGPIFGAKMRRAVGEARRREEAVLHAADFDYSTFEPHMKIARGTRRVALLWLEGVEISPIPDGLLLRFELPSGAYATILIDEFVR